MTEQLTPEEIAVMRRADKSWDVGNDVLKAIAYMLALHDRLERLRNMQAEDVTNKQRADWLNAPWHADRLPQMHAEMMAAAVRVMLASLDKPAEDFDK